MVFTDVVTRVVENAKVFFLVLFACYASIGIVSELST